MSITSAMFTGVSGLLANAEGINVIGNNLANVNTVGFKSGRMLFSDMLSANIGNESQIGRGTQIQKVDNIYSQGSFETTEAVTDLAIQGNSFFAVMDPNATAPVNQNGAMLTRAGAFRLDSNFTLINPDGYLVLDTAGNPIKFSDNAAGITTANTAITTAYTPPATAYNTQAGTVNTAAGTLVTAVAAGTVAEVAAAAAIQTATAAAQTAATAATVAPSAATIAAAEAAFATLTSTTAANGAILATNFAAAFTTFDTALATANTANTAAMTTAAAPIATAEALLGTANGLAFSKITSIDPSGLVTYLGKDGITTNYYNTSGQVGVAANASNATTVQRLAVVSVANPGGLEKAGGTLFRPTTSSGISSAAFTLATNSANGSSEKIYTNSLEQSNVDMAAQFVKMILTQRAYSANSKTITTADEMTQEVLNLKR
ncbi:MAG: flagellar hook-basal body complex protein [Deltaproteobacteria bacterium]|nr:flagellar hook-basal body complex protein [Deltaproteobacteria bacterium]